MTHDSMRRQHRRRGGNHTDKDEKVWEGRERERRPKKDKVVQFLIQFIFMYFLNQNVAYAMLHILHLFFALIYSSKLLIWPLYRALVESTESLVKMYLVQIVLETRL